MLVKSLELWQSSRFWVSLMHTEFSEVMGAQLAWLCMAERGVRWLGVTGQRITQGFSLGSMSASASWVLIMTWDLPACGSDCQNLAEGWGLCPGCANNLWNGISHHFQSFSSQFRWFSIQLTLEALFSTLQDSTLKKIGRGPCSGMCYLGPKCKSIRIEIAPEASNGPAWNLLEMTLELFLLPLKWC